ncbi:hypothetical protein [Planomonospora parontospora]|uniref:hypothetical protein n=1 Tax=Planomonospora parontospora TaxID=58119 RepID=UPI001671135B|nr:hypothetical protein [Planomonospora parontospora]GGL06895.1 hypothetical protein GCM10014719_06270 [Planomonospora parontospora subsp. antibiotica]GII14157.1 hypothetical protein Ppa05_08830 [Planomonospora parontospora subsp. antibiotica]
MLKSKTRRRVAVKTAAIGAVGAGVLFGAVPAIASMTAAPKAVTYNCEPETGAASPYKFQMDLTGPLAPTPNGPVVATWKIGQPVAPEPSLLAPSAVAATERLVVEAEALVTGSPLPTQTSTVLATTSSTPGAVAQGSPLPTSTVFITMTPTATGVIGIQPSSFILAVGPTSGTGTVGDLYDCTPASPAEVTAAGLLITVKPSGTGTGTGTPSASATNTTTTPKPTITITHTITPEPTESTKTTKTTKTRQIEETPEGAASTGGGGEAGPDARMIMLSGALLVAAAGAGGLVLRRRTTQRG